MTFALDSALSLGFSVKTDTDLGNAETVTE